MAAAVATDTAYLHGERRMMREQMTVNVHLYVLGRYFDTRRVTVSPGSLFGRLARGDMAGALEAARHMAAEMQAVMDMDEDVDEAEEA